MVAIKDMEMPSCCAECNLTGSFNWEHYCDVTLDFIDLDSDTRPDNCPLVKIEEPKVGKWIIDDEEHGRIWHCHCSNCKKDPQDYIGGSENWWLVRLPDYCPNCGSKNER